MVSPCGLVLAWAWALPWPAGALVDPVTANLQGLQELTAKDEFVTYYQDEPQYTSRYCAPLDAPENKKCTYHVKWAFEQIAKAKYIPPVSNSSNSSNTTNATYNASEVHAAKLWLKGVSASMKKYAKVDALNASIDDFQKLFWCAPPEGNLDRECFTPPCMCTHPPCHMCLVPERPRGCTNTSEDIRCKPPKKALDYNGLQWPLVKVEGPGPYHILAIGDWGGMDTTLPPEPGRDPLMPWWGWGLPTPGPTPFPRTRWNKKHDFLMCNHAELLTCYKMWGAWGCKPECGYDKDIDSQAQLLVAKTMKQRAEQLRPKFILNVGDNFYWGGIEKDCGTPMDELSSTATHQFDQIFEGIYNGPGLDGIPWFSVLGNHDWGGRQFNNGWDQQIAYTWRSNRWVLPAAYYTVKVYFEEENFWADLYFVDSNNEDGKDMWLEPQHNICSEQFNPKGATCGAVGGPWDVNSCHQWFWDLWGRQQGWLAGLLETSTAQWQIAVTHFPCGTQKNYWMDMHNRLGLDLLITGHRHNQEFWWPDKMGGLTCFITGGGGGISSEMTPNPYWKRDWYGEAQYGFYDLLISKDKITITSIDWSGIDLLTADVWPKWKW